MRTPLNGILGNISLLLDSQLDLDQLELLVTVRNSADALLALVADILDLKNIDTIVLDYQPFDIRQCVEGALDSVAMQAHLKGLELIYIASHAVPVTAISDMARLRQVMINLLSNGIKFTTAGQVLLTVDATPLKAVAPDKRTEDKDSVRLSLWPMYELRVTVQDTGMLLLLVLSVRL